MGLKQTKPEPETKPNCVPPETQPNCVPPQPPIEVAPNCVLPPQYATLYPNPTLNPNLQQVQQLKDYVKSQIKSASLQRAGLAGSDPWGTTEHIGALIGENLAHNPEALAAGVPPVFPDPAIFGQPPSLLNFQGKNGPNGAPQLINSEVTYFAPTYAANTHREVVNCCEDCCEDVCENCCLNCCLDCSKITGQLFGTANGTLVPNGKNGNYVLLQNALPLNPLTGLPATPLPLNPLTGLPATPLPLNPMTGCPSNPLPLNPMTGCPLTPVSVPLGNPVPGAPITVCPIHQTSVCPTNPCVNGINSNTIGNIKLN